MWGLSFGPALDNQASAVECVKSVPAKKLYQGQSTHSTAVTCILFRLQMSTAAAHSVASGWQPGWG